MRDRSAGDAVRHRGPMRGSLCLWPEGILFHGSNVRTTRTRPSTASVVFARSGQLRVRIGTDPAWVAVRCAVLAPNVPQQVESVDGDLVMLKIDPETKAIPVIMLSNLAGENDVETALSKGAVKYIIKSEHDPKEIADMVKQIVAGYTRNEIPTAS